MAMSTSALVGSSGQSNNPLLANSGPLPPSLDPSVTQMAGHAVMEDVSVIVLMMNFLTDKYDINTYFSLKKVRVQMHFIIFMIVLKLMI